MARQHCSAAARTCRLHLSITGRAPPTGQPHVALSALLPQPFTALYSPLQPFTAPNRPLPPLCVCRRLPLRRVHQDSIRQRPAEADQLHQRQQQLGGGDSPAEDDSRHSGGRAHLPACLRPLLLPGGPLHEAVQWQLPLQLRGWPRYSREPLRVLPQRSGWPGRWGWQQQQQQRAAG